MSDNKCYVMQSMGEYTPREVASALKERDFKSSTDLIVEQQGSDNNKALSIGNGQLHQITMSEQCNTLDCMHSHQMILHPGSGTTEPNNEKRQRKYIVRRLTPLECIRLQGFPDNWFDGVEGSDSAKYKALGNSLAIPCAYDVLNRIAQHVESEEAIGNKNN